MRKSRLTAFSLLALCLVVLSSCLVVPVREATFAGLQDGNYYSERYYDYGSGRWLCMFLAIDGDRVVVKVLDDDTLEVVQNLSDLEFWNTGRIVDVGYSSVYGSRATLHSPVYGFSETSRHCQYAVWVDGRTSSVLDSTSPYGGYVLGLEEGSIIKFVTPNSTDRFGLEYFGPWTYYPPGSTPQGSTSRD